MKKILLVVLIISLMLMIVGCNNNTVVEYNPSNKGNTENTTQNPIIEEVDEKEQYIGEDQNGTQVKRLVSQVITENKDLSDEEKTSVQLNAFRGTVSATNNEDKLLNIYSYIGGDSSLYRTEVSGDNGKLIIINQTEGTPSDPEIPIETNEDDLMMYSGYEFDESSNIISSEVVSE